MWRNLIFKQTKERRQSISYINLYNYMYIIFFIEIGMDLFVKTVLFFK